MTFKYTPTLLKQMEEIFKEGGYTVRYERGNFQNGYCILENKRVVVINKFHELEAKVNSMMEILTRVENLQIEHLSSESSQLYQQIMAGKAEELF